MIVREWGVLDITFLVLILYENFRVELLDRIEIYLNQRIYLFC